MPGQIAGGHRRTDHRIGIAGGGPGGILRGVAQQSCNPEKQADQTHNQADFTGKTFDAARRVCGRRISGVQGIECVSHGREAELTAVGRAFQTSRAITVSACSQSKD